MELANQLDDYDACSELEELLSGCTKLTAIDLVGGIYCNLCHTTVTNKKDFDHHYTVQHNKTTAEIVYTCVPCRAEIAPYTSFRNHCYLKHVNKDKFKCVHCGRQFSKQSSLNSHIASIHLFKCSTCQKQFETKNELHIHRIIHKRVKDQPPYPCQQCSKTIDNLDACELHIDEHCVIMYPCPICNETTASKLATTKHLTKHFNEEITDETISTEISAECSVDMLGVLCNHCDELFKNKIDFDLHFLNEHPDKEFVYSCTICGKIYNHYHLFANHCYFHVAKNRFTCADCGKQFSRLSRLVLHTEAFHANGTTDDKPFSCLECGHAFGSVNRLRRHLRIAHTMYAFTCPQEGCNMAFECSRDLILHQRQHKAASDNWCRQCGMQFTTLNSCQAHLDIHCKKNYSCPICNREYNQKHLMMKHIPSHFESVLHVCKVCGKVYNARNRLVQHTKTHSKIRHNICRYCGKGFIKPFQLTQHLNVHIGAKPYKCVECPKTFANSPNWMKHLRNMHNISKEKIKAITEETRRKAKTEPAVENTNNNGNSSKSESGIDSTSPEISWETYLFESDESNMDKIDATIAKDWSIMNETSILENSLQYTDLMPVNNTAVETDLKPIPIEYTTVPDAPVLQVLEYGPEFSVLQDDHCLPHIDPRLTTAREPWPSAAAAWEPCVSVMHAIDTDDRMQFYNTDVY